MRHYASCLPVALALVASTAAAQTSVSEAPPALTIPRLDAPPDFEDFLDMDPSGRTSATMARVERFVQRWPDDGQPERMKTVAYVGYTDDALHVVYLAFDPEPSALRAHLIRREEVFTVNDDEVELRLDTFGDRRQSYYFVSNPLGVQLDAAWPEFEGQYDESFDLVWHSRGQRTSQGFVVSMSIPFRSLRFRPGDAQTWGVYFGRWIPRTGEWSFWPRISNRQQSLLGQMARLEGIHGVSQGSGIQLIPYGSSRAFKAIDVRAAAGPRFARDALDPAAGLDAKIILGDALVLDATANPDFSQVESDAPQITANERFELFFPEKRPFFLENAGFLQTPINLLFTRRLADPQLGAKVTGKVGRWTIGGLAADDLAPGKLVADGHPSSGDRAWAGVVRASRNLFGLASVGGLVTHRSFDGRENTVAAADTRVRLGKVWTAEAQLATSRFTSATAGTFSTDGSAYLFTLVRGGRTLTARTEVDGRSGDFVTDLGFLPRVGVHEATQTVTYTARPAQALADWGPTVLVERVWAHDGTPLDWRLRPSVAFNFQRSTNLAAFAQASRVILRPGDLPGLAAPAPFRPDTWGFNASSSPRPAWSTSVSFTGGRNINFAPAAPRAPETGRHANARIAVGLRPLTPLRIENTWLRTSLDLEPGRAFVSDILRTQWAWQFTREWSVRFIGQYDRTRTDPALSSVTPRRNVNVDVLLMKLINPWTALYVGYNGNAQNVELHDAGGIRSLRRTGALSVDGWQVFAKWSHLLRW
jgi:hypothetical protein